MTTERKRWWRQAVTAAVGGGIVAGGLFGIVRATAQPQKEPALAAPESTWTRSAAPAPSVAEVERTPSPGFVTPASGTVPIPTPAEIAALRPALPAVPPLPGPLPISVDSASGPRAPETGLVGTEKGALPAVPTLPGVELPNIPAVPTDIKPALPPTPAATPPLQPTSSLPALPPLSGNTGEAPKAPTPPALPDPPAFPPLPSAAPVPPPLKPTDPMPPMPPVKPDSGLIPMNPGNTLNPASPVAPASPIAFPTLETPATPVGISKPTDPSLGSSEKFVFPVPAGRAPLVPTPRDPAMFNLKYTAALAVIGGAMLTAEQAKSAALVPVPVAPAVPAVPVKADATTDKLQKDLDAANDKIKALEKQVAKLTELLTGKKDFDGSVLPSDPGAVEEVKRLRNRLADLETELKELKKTQTTLKPIVTPEVKPKGVVKVVNEYPVEISMVINEKSHRIAPNTKVEVEIPAGEFSYQLLQSGAAATRSVIKDKETVTLRIK